MGYIDGSFSCLHVLPSEYATIKIIIMIKRSPVSMQALKSFFLIVEDEIEQSAKPISLTSKATMAIYGDASRDKDNDVVGDYGYTHGGVTLLVLLQVVFIILLHQIFGL